jgi:hypothetical protein
MQLVMAESMLAPQFVATSVIVAFPLFILSFPHLGAPAISAPYVATATFSEEAVNGTAKMQQELKEVTRQIIQYCQPEQLLQLFQHGQLSLQTTSQVFSCLSK